MRFAHNNDFYCGQENSPNFRLVGEPDIGASENVMIRLSKEIPRYQNYKIHFNKFYTSVPLAPYLFKQRFQCVEKIQGKTTSTCKFQDERKLINVPRGLLKYKSQA